jgi:hypothetical protein
LFRLDIFLVYLHHRSRMTTFSTRQAAKQLGIDLATLSRYIRAKKVPAPKSATSGGMTIHFWTKAEIEHVRRLLPKIANGRKTRYKKQSAISSQRSAKAKPKKK